MRTILFLIQKEFIQIFRNKTILPIIIVIPIVQLIILAYAATLEIKNIKVCVVDNDRSGISKQLISKFGGSPFFKIESYSNSVQQAQNELKSNTADMIIHIPAKLEEQLVKENSAKLQIILNAINGTVAGIANGYTNSIIAEFNKDIISDWYGLPKGSSQISSIQITNSFWYNPELNYSTFMVPGILVILITIIGMFLSGLNLVREKEIGTIEQINVTPIKKYHFIIGKLLPFWIIALFELAFGLTIGKIIFDIPIVGNLGELFFAASVYLFAVMGIGLWMSTMSENQQQLMFMAFFFLLVFVLMSGIFTSVESIPKWAQSINYINPLYYFMKIIRMLLLKGSGIGDFIKELVSLGIYGLIAFSLAVWRYKKVA